MTLAEKKKKAAMIAVAYYIEQEKAALENDQNPNKITWSRTGIEMIMNKRMVMQRRGRLLRSA